ncbi:MAG: DeoR family transcriptional regulator [Candidatus Altiarchaeota archaeon]|nr:DeoR family transcriptional regulator [Candidatus Altiarchaeota archaeon]
MDIDTRFAAGLAIASISVVTTSVAAYFYIRHLRKPQVEFLDVVYDRAARQLELYVANEGERPIYLNPSLRLVHFLNPDEWKEKKSSTGEGMMEGKCYQVESVIKGYNLIGECQKPVVVEGMSVRKIVYPLSEDVVLRAYDNVRVESLCGLSNPSGQRMVSVMRVVLKDDNDTRAFDTVAPAYNPNFCVVTENPEKTAAEAAGVPVQAMCVCCGKDRWLEWVVDGNHVCSECKDFMQGSSRSSMLPDEEAASFIQDSVQVNETAEGEIQLNDRQREIIALLENENNLTVRKISKMLSASESTISSDLKYLMENDKVGRVEIGRRFLYHLN